MNFDKRKQSTIVDSDTVEQVEAIEHIEDIEDFYIQGSPIKTEIGFCHFIKVKDYSEMIGKLSVLVYDKNKIMADMHQQKKKASGEHLKSLIASIEVVEQGTTFKIIKQLPNFDMAYQELFSVLFRDDGAWKKVSEQNFNYYRELIAKMNGITLPETNPNPEIQAFLDMAAKSKSGEGIGFTTLMTSVAVGQGASYAQINNYTVFQLNMTFRRIAGFKDYDTSTLFATVAEKVDISNWSKNHEIAEKNKHVITKEELDQTANKVFNNN
ncbi:hypothetical protein CIL05_06785 [Virgibacillus profundi]|uniref:Uncharacterized protein n=1 Tax=Virgibacillus profundi TaxID=2024555 RepID=A0A2A2IEV0_9BACI|nr:hypothetical protein [Virgibacillus profundi]PAV30167.1 hypothetical protein CIL05_06785 [Virgibacillus profundi]PXY54339.1 hypothetical protein CIT14_06870 [Virgibacillus profundi]